MKTILVAVDFSDVASNLVKTVKTLASALKCRVILLHVRQTSGLTDAPVGEQIPLTPNLAGPVTPILLQEETNEEAQKQLDHFKKHFDGVRFAVTTQQCKGPAVDMILHACKADSVDLIVMGSHGHSALYNLLLGSVTAGVLKSATCPVLVVPSPRAS